MKSFIVFAALFVVVLADGVTVLRSNTDVGPESYFYDVETSDGTVRHEEGQVKDVGSEHPSLVVHGTFSWKDEKDGKIYTVSYVADENGFQPVGEHLPKN